MKKKSKKYRTEQELSRSSNESGTLRSPGARFRRGWGHASGAINRMGYNVHYTTCAFSTGNRTSDYSRFLPYSGEPGRDPAAPERGDPADAARSPAGSCLSRANCAASADDCADATAAARLFRGLRARADVVAGCADRVASTSPNADYECFDGHCLFDVRQDPCEYRNVAGRHPEELAAAVGHLERFRGELVPQRRPAIDPDADPARFGGYWDTWMDRDA